MSVLSNVIDNQRMQKIRDEFLRLGEKCYLDNAGAALYPRILLKKVNEDLLSNVYLNPHSDKYTSDCIEQIRSTVLKHFNTDTSTYTVIFTSGATQSLKLVAESFQFHSNDDDEAKGSFLYLTDNHTSVIGMRETAKEKNAEIIHITPKELLTSIKPSKQSNDYQTKDCKSNTLFVYPAQSNSNGYKYSINCLEDIRNGCLNGFLKKQLCDVNCNWYILLDAASYVSTNNLDLSITQPDFVCLSFYKIFGFPTGVGALLVKNSSANILSQKSYFGGGTVDIVLSTEDFHIKRNILQERNDWPRDLILTNYQGLPQRQAFGEMKLASKSRDLAKYYERFEDGTLPFLSIIALKHCFDTFYHLIPKIVNNNTMDTISMHTYYLAKDLYEQLSEMRHKNGCKAAVFYLDSDFSDPRLQGGIVTFNLVRDNGSYIGYTEFQHMADLFNVSIRTGCFCNTGSCQRHLNFSNKDIKQMYKLGHRCGGDKDLIYGKPTGSIRASFGYYNTFNDVDALVSMITKCFVTNQTRQPERKVINFGKEPKMNGVIKKPKTNRLTNEPKTNGIIPEPITNGVLKELKTNGVIKESKINEITFKERIVTIFNNNFLNNGVQEHLQSEVTLIEIAIFPIKSCGAFKISSSWKIGLKGFEYDREWMIVKDNGVCLTQKQNTLMCKIKPFINFEKDCLTLYFKGQTPISIPLDPTQTINNNKYRDTQVCQSKVCTDMVQGIDCGDEVADWISNALGMSYLRLIRQSSDRIVKNSIQLLSLSNQAQYLLINKETVQWLKSKIKDETFMDDVESLTDRFRGNLIIDSPQELIEREWEKVVIGKHEFKVDSPCTRCQMVCIDQKTGDKTVEPLKTISEEFGGKLRFGIYLSYIGPVNGYKDNYLEVSSKVTSINV